MSSRRLLFVATVAVATALGAGCASRQEESTSRTAGQFTDDAATTAKVKTAIATDVGARAAAAINVDTYRGVVQLTGFVADQDTASRAEAAAKKVSGVKSIKNDIRLKSSS